VRHPCLTNHKKAIAPNLRSLLFVEQGNCYHGIPAIELIPSLGENFGSTPLDEIAALLEK
jgi:hypothetical protein